VPDCTPFAPFPSAFNEAKYEYTNGDYRKFDGVGPVGFFPRIWDAGLPPANPAPFAGELSWFAEGIPANRLPP
jgi:hypothetical protein